MIDRELPQVDWWAQWLAVGVRVGYQLLCRPGRRADGMSSRGLGELAPAGHASNTMSQGEEQRRRRIAEEKQAVSDEPLEVLVNESTGGAAEIVAAAILDNHRGDVVGARTFGMGSIQKTIPLDDGAALILSVAKYYTPVGKQIQETGVTPNVVVLQDRQITALEDQGNSGDSVPRKTRLSSAPSNCSRPRTTRPRPSEPRRISQAPNPKRRHIPGMCPPDSKL